MEDSGKIVESLVVQFIKAIGDDPVREGLEATPMRVYKATKELFSGYGVDPASLFVTFEAPSDDSGMVVLRNCEFFSMCEHHILPFYGICHIGYIPDNRVIGISKIARIVEVFSRRLQIQERLTKQIVTCLTSYLAPKGVICVMEAVHMCMRSRGVRLQRSSMVTAEVTGLFADNSSMAKMEFMNYIRGGKYDSE